MNSRHIVVFLFAMLLAVPQALGQVDPTDGPQIFVYFNDFVGVINSFVAAFFFFDVFFFTDAATMPLAVFWLVLGALFFTFRLGFVNVRAFGHAIAVVRGKYDNEKDVGDVSHFQALTAALSATVGLGNIAGVAIAVTIGGPGATFWMIVAGFLGMCSKCAECTLGQQYREIRSDGRVMGGAMEYLSKGLAEMGHANLGKFLAVAFCVLCILGSLGGGNAFQVVQSMNAVSETMPFLLEYNWLYGLLMATAVGVVIIGGIKRIAQTAERIVPTMCGIYVLACLYIIITHASLVPAALQSIVVSAFSPDAAYGGAIGVIVMGFQRAAFSNEAGIGSAAIAHSAARTAYPAREGIVAILEPFIDTIVICTMTSLVILISGAYNNPIYADLIDARAGAALTSRAFGETLSWFPYVLSVAVVLFAYSTMISWFYYGERCWSYLFTEKRAIIYRWVFVIVAFLGSIVSASNVLDFSDLMLLGMAFPNLVGLYFLNKKVKSAIDDYMAKLRGGEFN